MKKNLTAALLTTSLFLSMVTGCDHNASKETTKKQNDLETQSATVETNLNVDTRSNGQTPIFKLAATNPGNTMSEEELNQAYSTFIFEMMKRCATQANGSNVLISPDSVLFALEMTAAGADGQTLDQMLNTLVPGADHTSAFQFSVDRMNSLQDDSMQIANSIWINQADSNSIYEDYLNYVERHFDASVSILPFDGEAVPTINAWVAEKTKDRISSLLDQLDPASIMVLINAMTFDGKWTETYEDAKVYDQDFTNGNGETSKVPFLHSTESIYLHNDEACGFIKKYDGGKYAFMTILPNDESVDINTFMANMTADEYWTFWNSADSSREVHASMPEFHAEYSISLSDILVDMGMKDAFSEGAANFSNMCQDPVFISKVIHKTYIDVNREGTQAAAATAVVMEKETAMEEDPSYYVRCDRPYAYAIVDMDTGLPVFLGTVETV